MELGGYISVVRRWWLVLLASVVVAALGGFMVASQLPKVYEAEARLLVGPLNTDFDTQRAAGQIANTYAQLATSRRIIDSVLQRTGANLAPEDLQDVITAVPNDVTRIVIIRVQDTDSARAAALANAVAEELGLLAAESERPEGRSQIIDAAEPSTVPVAPQVLLIMLLAAFAGLLSAIALVVFLEYARDPVRSEDELRSLADVPILGHLPTRLNRRLDVATALLDSKAAHEYLAMTARIEQSLGSRKPRSILVVGIEPGAQTGIAGLGLALAFGDRGIPAAFVDGSSLDVPVSAALGMQDSRGVDERGVEGDVPFLGLEVAVAAEHPGSRRMVPISVLPRAIRGEIVKTERLQAMLDGALRESQVAIVTATQPDRTPDALLWAGLIDAIVLVVPMPGTSRRRVRAAAQALQVARKRFIGTVLTDPPISGRYEFRQPAETQRRSERALSGSHIRADRSPRAARDVPGAGPVR